MYAEYGSSYWGRNLDCVREYRAEEDIWTKRNEVTAAWRRLSEEGLHDMYCTAGDEIKANAMTGTCGTYGVGGKRQLGRPRLILEDNNETDLKEIGLWTRIGLICLLAREGGGVLVNAVVNIKVA